MTQRQKTLSTLSYVCRGSYNSRKATYLGQLWVTGGSWEGLYYAKPSVTYC